MATTAGCDPDPSLQALTDLVLGEGVAMEERWIREHVPDVLNRKCKGCNRRMNGGICYFNRAAHRARDIRTKGKPQ